MPIETFGASLLRTLDLDPVYVMLHKAALSTEVLHRWCLAYWCDYHAGVASYAAEREGYEYIRLLHDVAVNSTRRWPRGTERRHFRGASAVNLVMDLERKYKTASQFVEYVAGPYPRTFQQVAKRVQEHNGFGPWIAFKIADMLERVLGLHVDFSDCQLGFYREPIAGAVRACHWWGEQLDVPQGNERTALNYAINRLMETFGDEYAPPDFKRFIGIAEIETILCKWKSHTNGHYPVGKDTAELRHALEGFGPLASRLAEYLPEEV